MITNLFDDHLDLHFTDFIAILTDNICRIFQRTTFARFLPFRSRTRAKYQTNQIQMKKSHFQNFKKTKLKKYLILIGRFRFLIYAHVLSCSICSLRLSLELRTRFPSLKNENFQVLFHSDLFVLTKEIIRQ